MQEAEQLAEHYAAQEQVAALMLGWPKTDWGYAPVLATRKSGNVVSADSLRAGDAVRIRSQGQPIDWAEVRDVVRDPGCPWNGAWFDSVYALLVTTDGLARLLRVSPDTQVERRDDNG